MHLKWPWFVYSSNDAVVVAVINKMSPFLEDINVIKTSFYIFFLVTYICMHLL